MKPHYTSYTAAALATDDAFIGWVLRGEDDVTWRTWRMEHPDIGDRVDAARALVLALHAQPAWSPDPEKLHSLWTSIEASARTTSARDIRRGRSWIRLWPVVAAAAIALLIWWVMPGDHQTIIADAGVQQEVQLPEESQVILNAASQLSYAANAFAHARTLQLAGEAFFNVKPGSTFTVETAAGFITVLGTSFNVYAREGRLEVMCYSGKVRVTGVSGEAVDIKPGEQVSTSGNKLKGQAFVVDPSGPAWTSGRFRFDNRPLREVIAELERQFAVDVIYAPELGDLAYTGLFERGDLDKALHLITWPLHLQYRQDGRTVYLVP